MDFSPLTLAHLPAWSGLLAAAFDRTPGDMQSLLRWLHDGYPVVAWGAWDDDRLAAQYSCRIVTLCLPDGVSVPAGMSINMAVHPDYRGRGLIKHVAQPVYEQVARLGGAAGVGFSNTQGVQVDLKSKHYGYRVVGRMIASLVWLNRRYTRPPLSLTGADSVGLLHGTGKPSGLIRFGVSPGQIQHRFARHPFRRYEFGLWQEGDPHYGLVIFRTVRFSALKGASLLAAYSHDLPELLQRWAAALRQRGVVAVHALTSPRSPLQEALRGLGARLSLPYSRSPYYLTAKSLGDHTPNSIFDFAQWDCCGGDIL